MRNIELKSDLVLSQVGLGCWQFSKGIGRVNKRCKVLTDEEICGIIITALSSGINWFDTAEMYGWGASERVLSKVLKTIDLHPSLYYIMTKWFPSFRTAKNIIKTIDERIEALGGLKIDLYQIHYKPHFSSVVAQMEAMAELVQMGKIKYIGVSNYSAKDLVKAHSVLDKLGLPLISNQIYYSKLHRNPETDGTLDAAKDLGIKILAWSPTEGGKLKDGVKWLVDQGVFPIVGVSNPSQLRENLKGI